MIGGNDAQVDVRVLVFGLLCQRSGKIDGIDSVKGSEASDCTVKDQRANRGSGHPDVTSQGE
jgi:hypothetical protein